MAANLAISKGPTGLSSNKAKIARRVIEVLEFFDDSHREATVMDIVRRYGRPQSSTSELLSSLVELGLLRKDRQSRTYSLTSRAALLGTGGQTAAVRDGRLVRLLDRLSAQTGLPVALFGMNGLDAQIYAWRPGRRGPRRDLGRTVGGMQHPLSHSAAGWLLLSTLAQPRRDLLLRRLNAEACDARKFSCAELAAQIGLCEATGDARGPAGFGSTANLVAKLLPCEFADDALVLAVLFGRDEPVNQASLSECLSEAFRQALGDQDAQAGNVRLLPSAA